MWYWLAFHSGSGLRDISSSDKKVTASLLLPSCKASASAEWMATSEKYRRPVKRVGHSYKRLHLPPIRVCQSCLFVLWELIFLHPPISISTPTRRNNLSLQLIIPLACSEQPQLTVSPRRTTAVVEVDMRGNSYDWLPRWVDESALIQIFSDIVEA